MPAAPLPPDEVAPPAALRAPEILDTPPAAELEALARAAALTCGVPIALVCLIDHDLACIKAAVGLTDLNDTPRIVSFCARVSLGPELAEVEDARDDPRFGDDPLVLGGPLIRFCASIPLRLSDGSVVGTLCVIDQRTRRLDETQRELLRALATVGAKALDVTQARVRAAQLTRQLKQQEEATERETVLFRNASDLLSIIRVEQGAGHTVFRFEAMNPAATRIAGWQPEELVGRRPEECLPPELAEALVRQYAACVARGDTITFELSAPTSNGRRDLEGSLTPIRHPTTGWIERLASATRDVTERKRLAAVAHHAEKMEAISGIAAGVAHDFNNILQSITSSLELVQDTLAPASPAYDVATIGLESARRGAYLTHHLLSYARMQMLRPQRVPVEALLTEVRTLLGRTLAPHVAVTVVADAATPDVWVDPGQIRTALLNLAINAAQAMPAGGALVIEAQAVPDAGHPGARISVSDTGTGMDAATLERAAEPFFTSKGLEGTGLGLSMVQGFAEQSGGTMSISSAPGQGTRVVLELPAAAAKPAVAAPPEQPGQTRRIDSILLVDDDADVLLTTGAFLESAGFKVIQAANAEAALALLEHGVAIDAVLTDYAMPGLNGSDLIKRARATRAGLPGVIITGLTDVADMDALGVGTVTLRKPFPRASLISALRSLGTLPDAAEPLHASTAAELDQASPAAGA